MKKIIVSILLCLLVFGASAQNDEVFEIVEYNPQYIGGEEAMRSFIDEKMVYPASAIEEEKEGTVIIEFIVEKDSSLSNIKAVKSFDDDCAAEAVRIVKMMKWAAGKQRGKPVRVKCRIPVRFRLADRAGRELPPPIPPPMPEPKQLKKDSTGEVFEIVEQIPEYPGGQEAMYKFISKKLKYPKAARKKGVEGTVFVQFVVDKEGNVTRAKVIKDIGEGCGQAALDVVNKMPKWQPGMQRGKPVAVMYRLPFKFRLK